MIDNQLINTDHWARATYGKVELGDPRRTKRVVQMARAMARRPGASLPMQMGDAAALKAAYRLLDSEAVSMSALASPHWEATRQAAGAHEQVLLIQDTTELDYSHYPTTEGLGPIGDGRAQGILLHSTLAVVPTTRTVLGLAYQEPFLCQPSPEKKGVGADKRRYRSRESQVWERATHEIGAPPPDVQWIHVGDRYADIFDWMEGCVAQAKAPLKDAAVLNSTRWALHKALVATGLPLEVGSGGRTKWNRSARDLPKTHWLDAACVGASTPEVLWTSGILRPLQIRASGHGSRQMCAMDKHGFPRTRAKQAKRVQGFQTGDIVNAVVPTGKKQGTHVGRVAVRASGSFNIRTANGLVEGISYRYCRLLHRVDGYAYS